jgi:hypothetical protein
LILDDVKRRDFLRHLGVAGGATLVDTDRIISTFGGLARPDERVLDDLEIVSRGLVDDYWTASPISVFPAVQGHLLALRGMLTSHESGELGGRLRRIVSEAATLAGWLAFRLENRGDAHALWAFAAALAEEAGDGPLRAYALIARTNLYSATWRDGRHGDPDTAIALLDLAAFAAGWGSSPLMRAWLYARRAEEHAVRGDAFACNKDLDRAERALSHASTPDDGFLRSWDAVQLAGYRGSCAQLLGQSKEAAAFSRRPFRGFPSHCSISAVPY